MMARTHWLLDLDVDTQIVRLSTVSLDVVRDDGTVMHYDAGIEVDTVMEEISLLSPSASAPEASMVIYLDTVTPLALLRATGALSRWTEGTTYELRRRVIKGQFQSPQMGQPHEGISTTLAQDVWVDPAMLIASSQVVNSTTWSTSSTLLDGAIDLPYPVIIGHPGRSGSSFVPALVTLRLDATLGSPGAIAPNFNGVAYLLAGHHVTATRVRLSTETDLIGIQAHVINTYDNCGQPVAVCPWFLSSTADPITLTYNAAQTYTFTDGVDQYGVGNGTDIAPAYNIDAAQPAVYAAFEDEYDATSGGLQIDGQLIRTAGDVLKWALSVSGVHVDRLRMGEAVAALRGYHIDAVIAERVSPWEWVTQVLLPLLPCSMAAGPDGFYIVSLFLDATEADAEARLDTRRPDVQRAGPLTWDTSKLVRSVTVRQKYDVRTSTYTSQVVYGSQQAADADPTNSTRSHPTLTAAAGFRAGGADLVIESAAIYETDTCAFIGHTLARIYGLPIGAMTFDVPEDDARFSRLHRGSVVYCYDDDTGIDRIAQVCSIQTAGNDSLIVGVWFFLDPLRDSLQ